MRINLSAKIQRLDPKLRVQLLDHVEKSLRSTARSVMIRAANKVPVWTGMAKGAFIPVGLELQFVPVIVPMVLNKKYQPVPGGPWVAKNKAAGAALSKFVIKVDKAKGTFSAVFQTQVEHFNINEIYNSRIPTQRKAPWYIFKEAEEEFRDEMERKLVYLRQMAGNMIGSYKNRTSISYGFGSLDSVSAIYAKRGFGSASAFKAEVASQYRKIVGKSSTIYHRKTRYRST
jgi:hypothetical protein